MVTSHCVFLDVISVLVEGRRGDIWDEIVSHSILAWNIVISQIIVPHATGIVMS